MMVNEYYGTEWPTVDWRIKIYIYIYIYIYTSGWFIPNQYFRLSIWVHDLVYVKYLVINILKTEDVFKQICFQVQ